MAESMTGSTQGAGPLPFAGATSCPGRAADREPVRSPRAAEEQALVARTLAGDPAAFGALVDRHQASLLRLARALGHADDAAEAVLQSAWIAILAGLSGFGFERPLRTWMMAVVAGWAMRRDGGPRPGSRDPGEGAAPGGFDSAGRWTVPPRRWDERALQGAIAAAAVERALANLPGLERAVVTLRDVERVGADDTCAILRLGPGRQRALLHRGRERIRRALDARLCVRPPHAGQDPATP
jgi:RNA polymerase sigma-70 factor, ECF subfamily